MNRNYSKLEDELANARKVVFKRPDGTAVMVKTAVVDKTLSLGTNPMRYADECHDVIFDKDIVSRTRLSNILGVNYINDLAYIVDLDNDTVKHITIMDSGNIIGTAEKYHYKGVRKRFKRYSKLRYNDLVREVSKEYTFKLPDGRVVLGTDLSDYEQIPSTGQIAQAIKFINNHSRHRIHDIDLLLTIGFVIENDDNITIGLTNALTGEYLVPLDYPNNLLSNENKARLHRQKDEYLAALQNTEEMIINRIGESKHN